MEKKLKVIYKKVNQSPKVIEINNTLEAKQKLVGGLIEVIPYKDDLLLICNEEGKILNKKANIDLGYDYIAGDFLVVRDDIENADFKSLTQNQINQVLDDLKDRSIKYTNQKDICEER